MNNEKTTAIERLASLEKANQSTPARMLPEGLLIEEQGLRSQIAEAWTNGNLSLGMDQAIFGVSREKSLGYLLLEQYTIERGLLEAGSWKDYFEAGEEPTEEEYRQSAETYYYAGVNFLKNA